MYTANKYSAVPGSSESMGKPCDNIYGEIESNL